MTKAQRSTTVSIRMTVLGVFLIVTGLTAGLALGLQYHFSHSLARNAAESYFRAMSEKVGERIRARDNQYANLAGMLSNISGLQTIPDPDQQQRLLPLLGAAMENNSSLYAVYVGYRNGDFYELVNLESGANVRTAYSAAPHDRWVVVKITTVDGNRIKKLTYLDAKLGTRISRRVTTSYDPRKRPWFYKALLTPGVTRTQPYIFSNLQVPGVTYAKNLDGEGRVIGLDISLEGLSTFLKKQKVFPGSQIFLFDGKGKIHATAIQQQAAQHLEGGTAVNLTKEETAFIQAHPVILASNEMDWPPFDFAMSGSPRGYAVDMLNLLAQKIGLRVEYVNGFSWQELVNLFQNGDLDLLNSIMKTPERKEMGVFTKSYMAMPQTFAVRSGTPLPQTIADLAGKTIAMPKGWATDIYLAKNYPEVKRLHVTTTLDALRAVSSGKAYAALDSEPVLQFLVDSYYLDNLKIGGHPPELAGNQDQGLHCLVHPEKAILATLLDKAFLQVTDKEKKQLHEKWFGDPPGAQSKATGDGTVPHRQLIDLALTSGAAGGLRFMEIGGHEYVGYVARLESVFGADDFFGLLAPVKSILRPYMEKVRYSLLSTLFFLLLLTPLVWYGATIIVTPINALALESEKVKQRRYDDVRQVQSNITEILGLSRSLVSMASSIQAYENSLKELMESFIKVIATAIDHKSPYTGGHCARVPELSIMLAKAARESDTTPLAGLSLNTDEEWHEFRTAAWLHDCGKIATPEYIVDKSTKLETIYNRIHEVRMRFEVLLRDAEITFLREVANGGEPETLKEVLLKEQRTLEDDFAFIAACNIGGESMDEDKVGRLREIAQRTWIRHLDDRLGLGHLELLRYRRKSTELPCTEPLLADRREHIIKRPKKSPLSRTDSRFAMEEPPHLYNLGELYNLSISRGTLTVEDRYKINEHIITTINMLEMLPYPENMTKIPEYAGAHHETLIGTGYPRRLTAEQIGMPARIMALADVFEALTASDRPYKKAKTLSEAVAILGKMVEEQHLDPDVYRLFLESGVYSEYAVQFLQPSQIDEVDVHGCLTRLEGWRAGKNG